MKKSIIFSCLCAFVLAGNVTQAQDITDGPEFSVSKTKSAPVAENQDLGTKIFIYNAVDEIGTEVTIKNGQNHYATTDAAFCFMGKRFEFTKIKDTRLKRIARISYKNAPTSKDVSYLNAINKERIANSMARHYIRNIA